MGKDLNRSDRIDATRSPTEPMRVVRILSDSGIGRNHASIRIAMPDIPNNTIRNILSDLSIIVYSFPSKFGFTILNAKVAIWLAVSVKIFKNEWSEYLRMDASDHISSVRIILVYLTSNPLMVEYNSVALAVQKVILGGISDETSGEIFSHQHR